MKYFYHYTLEKNVSSFKSAGVFRDSSFTTDEYYDAFEAGQALGLMAHYIDCVLKFRDDGKFRQCNNVQYANRFIGGGIEYQHASRPKPIAVRRITDKTWKSF